jgi:predicted Rossmann-fold nucleotide-binding protein
LDLRDALGDYLENKTPVGIMGGHKLQRQSKQYRRVVMLARQLAQLGFLVVTGGGPGAMEAANLGAYLADRSDDAVDEALEILAVGNDKYEFEYQNVEAADNVLKRFGLPKHMPRYDI